MFMANIRTRSDIFELDGFLHFFALFIAFIAFLVNLWMNLKHVSSLSIDLKNRFLEIYGWT